MVLKSKKTTRVQIELPENSMRRLRDLKTRTEASSYADVIRESFIALENAVAIIDEGKILQVFDPKTGTATPFVYSLPILKSD